MDAKRVDEEIDGLFDDIDTLLKNVDVVAAFTERGVNASIAMLITDGLRAYRKGDKVNAAEDLATAAEEIASRLAAARDTASELAKSKPS
jgi:hypothetical protein